MPPGPSPKFSPREIFTDHNFEGDAFLKGLGNANVSPFKDVVEGAKEGLQIGEAVLGLIDKYGPAGQEARRLELEAKREALKNDKLKNEMAAVEARHTTATEGLALEEKKSQLSMDIANNGIARRKAEVRSQAATALSEIQDSRSLADYLNRPEVAILQGDAEFGKAVRAKAGILIPTSSAEEQVRLIQTAEAVSPGSGKQLENIASPAAQQMLLSPTERASINRSEALTAKARAGGATEGLSKPARQMVDNALAITGGIKEGDRIDVDAKGDPVLIRSTGEVSASGKPKTKMFPLNKLFGASEKGVAAKNEFIKQVQGGTASAPTSRTAPPVSNAAPVMSREQKLQALKQRGITKKTVETAVNAQLRTLLSEASRHPDLKIGKREREIARARLEADYINKKLREVATNPSAPPQG